MEGRSGDEFANGLLVAAKSAEGGQQRATVRLRASLGHVLHEDGDAVVGEDAVDLRYHGSRIDRSAEDADGDQDGRGPVAATV